MSGQTPSSSLHPSSSSSSSQQQQQHNISSNNLQSEYDNEIKEFHFHVYWFQTNVASYESAVKLRERILQLVKEGFFKGVVPLKNGINTVPRGPHPVGSFEVWCAREDFARCYSWFVLNRGAHSILIHPLTKQEIEDHSSRAAWLGTPVPLDLSRLTPFLEEVPSQYPELGLGYSAPTN
ncbi:hypothetical protein BX616_007398 [Lobosporangium transversale]|uniref:DOPA-like domain-containing protein n=1 Tax=Lobosporangium transversale TaxID=64571 RepID=A0A1Y2GFP7_9FUNG|nr:DOPA-like domain-containing protein [Lobosporangium transversale]KAF9896468.1 hypothetical protein BX616_007398 [Lobosporangium transversale]ORZ09638.1 DOPA-like domain-containing protein [Lobosporangium transversale]|eukprot:XP_021878908.1 DOPA-like domain-containing protein [Lobosporangium transversale]